MMKAKNQAKNVLTDTEVREPRTHLLKETAAAADVDECDICCDAMPAMIFGDLLPVDSQWIKEHTTTCNYCREMLEGYESVDLMLSSAQLEVHVPEMVFPGQYEAAYTVTDSPIGPLLVAVSDEGLCEVGFAGVQEEEEIRSEMRRRGFAPIRNEEKAKAAVQQLNEYFSGQRDQFDLPVDLRGVAPFTQAVLRETIRVPFGSLSTYREIAGRLGKPGASRAVGNALGRNPIPVVIPCHRIIKSDATLGGYAGGLQIKQNLLQLEGSALG